MIRRLLLVPAIVCALVVLAPTVGSADEGGTNRPNNVTLTGVITPTGGSFPGPFTSVITQTTIGTHTGNGTGLANISVTFAVPIVPCGPGGAGALFSFTGTGSITAANGDQLFTSISGSGCAVMSGTTVSGTTTIVGGTGRFVDASGSGTLTGTTDSTVSPATSETQVVGTISY